MSISDETYTLELTPAELVTLAGLTTRAEPYTPARRTLRAKALELRDRHFDARDPAGTEYRRRRREEVRT